ncbi:MAG TPA: PAS domain-containing protein [Bryobacteraceae bacterium]|jgi:hypothetical protein|nr:PAS domain-containing protein [Bryobacteraceae bacterium]
MKAVDAGYSQFDNLPAITYVLDEDFRLRYCNSAGDRFALQNDGAGLAGTSQIGRGVMEATPPALQPFYSDFYNRVLRTGEERSHLFECSSAQKVRLFQMSVRREGEKSNLYLVVSNSLVLERDIQTPEFRDDSETLREDNGLLIMCCHCRKSKVPGTVDAWVWIPEFVQKMPLRVSHGICAACFGLHYTR